MKSEKGITLATLLVYIAVIMIALITLGTITAYFQSNINEFNTKSTKDLEFDKFNLYIVKEAKITNNSIDMVNSNETKLIFTTGNKYEFIDNSIVLNDGIKIAENIEDCTFTVSINENDNEVITVYMKVGETERTNEYILSNQTENNSDNEDYIYGYKRVEGKEELILENSVGADLKNYIIEGNSIIQTETGDIQSRGKNKQFI